MARQPENVTPAGKKWPARLFAARTAKLLAGAVGVGVIVAVAYAALQLPFFQTNASQSPGDNNPHIGFVQPNAHVNPLDTLEQTTPDATGSGDGDPDDQPGDGTEEPTLTTTPTPTPTKTLEPLTPTEEPTVTHTPKPTETATNTPTPEFSQDNPNSFQDLLLERGINSSAINLGVLRIIPTNFGEQQYQVIAISPSPNSLNIIPFMLRTGLSNDIPLEKVIEYSDHLLLVSAAKNELEEGMLSLPPGMTLTKTGKIYFDETTKGDQSAEFLTWKVNIGANFKGGNITVVFSAEGTFVKGSQIRIIE